MISYVMKHPWTSGPENENLYSNARTSKELQSSDETVLAGEMFYANTFDFDVLTKIKFNTFNMHSYLLF